MYITAFTIFEKIYVTNTQTLLCTLPCLSTLQVISFNLTMTLWRMLCCYLYFTDGETEAQNS